MIQYIFLAEKLAKPYREQFNGNRTSCFCGNKDLLTDEIRGYHPHAEGWPLQGTRVWLYVHCNKCEHDWSLNKLGVPRNFTP
jgi:hypothetical protein